MMTMTAMKNREMDHGHQRRSGGCRPGVEGACDIYDVVCSVSPHWWWCSGVDVTRTRTRCNAEYL